MTPVGNVARPCGHHGGTGGQLGASGAPPRAPVDDAAGRWTTIMGVTSPDAMSSTIHSPYYRHCQNLNS